MGYSVTLAANTGASAASEASIEAASEMAVQIWLRADKLLNATGLPREDLIWFTSAALGDVKFAVSISNDGAGRLTIMLMANGTVLSNSGIQHTADGSGMDVSSLTGTEYVVLYAGHTPTTGVNQQEVGIYKEDGTLVDEAGRNFDATLLDTTAGNSQLWLNTSFGNSSDVDSVGTYKRIAVWNKAIASANRGVVPTGSESGLLSLYGDANGFTAGSGTTEPNQVAGGNSLTLDATVTWNNLSGGSAALFPPPQGNGGSYQ